MTGARGPAGVQSPLQGLAHGKLSMCERVCTCTSACLWIIASVGLTAARFTVELVGVDNSIREKTDLEAE